MTQETALSTPGETPPEQRLNGGRTHGLASTYNAGCHCKKCRDAIAAYRASRRAKGLDKAKPVSEVPEVRTASSALEHFEVQVHSDGLWQSLPDVVADTEEEAREIADRILTVAAIRVVKVNTVVSMTVTVLP